MNDLTTPLWQLTVKDFLNLLEQKKEIYDKAPITVSTEKRYVYGIAGIAQLFNCSRTTANIIKQSGKIDKAISQYGKKITVDAELALQLLNIDELNNKRKK